MKKIVVPERYNYMTAFLTLRCNLNCWYCLNRYGNNPVRKELPGIVWASGLNRIQSRPDLPITLTGGEPTLHKAFFTLINRIKQDLNIDLLTNLDFDVKDFATRIHPGKFNRPAPYASIRVSYHWPWVSIYELIKKVKYLQDSNYKIGIWVIEPPEPERDEEWTEAIRDADEFCFKAGIDFRTKTYLGYSRGKLYGTFKYPEGLNGIPKKVRCRTSELLIDPEGKVFRCHRDLYKKENCIGDILAENFEIEDKFRPCENYGLCNPCDLKVKYDRFQKMGHCAVEIRRR